MMKYGVGKDYDIFNTSSEILNCDDVTARQRHKEHAQRVTAKKLARKKKQ